MQKTLHTCERCGKTGKTGAEFVLCVGAQEFRVHKYCGGLLDQESAAQVAPGTVIRLVHWAELREEKRKARVARETAQTRAFWEEKFAQGARRKFPVAAE